MGERLDNLLDNKINQNNGKDTVGAAFQREYELLRDGLSTGMSDRLHHMVENLGETAVNLGICATAGAALNLASRAGGRWGTAAKIAGGVMGVVAISDVARRAVPTIGAMADTWSSPLNLEANKDTVAKYAGSALIDYPVMLAAGYGGYRLGGMVPMRTTVVEFVDLTNLNKMRDAAGKLADSGLPINPQTRALMENPAIKDLPPGARADALKALTSKPLLEPIKLDVPGALNNPPAKFDAAKWAEIANAKPAAVPKDLLGPELTNPGGKLLGEKPALPGEALNAKPNLPPADVVNSMAPKWPGGDSTGIRTTPPSALELQIRSLQIKPGDLTNFNIGNLSIARTRFLPVTIIPYDLMYSNQDQVFHLQKAGEGAVKGVIEGAFKQLKPQPKPEAKAEPEKAPPPREVGVIERLELPKLDFDKILKEQPNAVIQRHHRIMEHIEVNPIEKK